MKVVKGKYNDLSAELLAKIPKLQHGQEFTFMMLTGMKNPNPDPEEQKNRPVLYPRQNIPTRDRIKDVDGSYKDIILADGWIKDEPTKNRLVMPGMDVNQGMFFGKFSVRGGNVADEELYQYLMLTNYNEDSVLEADRDTSVTPLFRVVDVKRTAKETSNKVTTLKNALEKAVGITKEGNESQALAFAASLNWPTYPDKEELNAKILDMAREKPEEFLKITNDPMGKIKSLVKQAFDKGVLTVDLKSGEVKLNDNTIHVVPKEERKDVNTHMALWFNTAKNAPEVKASIELQLSNINKEEPVLA